MAKSISEIRLAFAGADDEQRDRLCALYADDPRSGVQALITKAGREKEKLAREYERLENMLTYEKKYRDVDLICGIDEAGRGPLAGPVVAAAVVLPKDAKILYLNDSKQLSAEKRETLYDVIMETALGVGVGVVLPERIDEINILQATYEAMREAVAALPQKPGILLNDAVKIPGLDIAQVPIIKGDAKSLSIAAASVIAKVTRDRMMIAYEALFPGYGFAKSKGYGTKEHIQMLKTAGPTPIHRASFIKNFI